MRRKSEAFEKFKEFHAETEKQLGKSFKILRSDRGGEYLDSKFTNYLIENGIVSLHLKMELQKEEIGHCSIWFGL